MRPALASLPLALLFLASLSSSSAQSDAASDLDPAGTLEVVPLQTIHYYDTKSSFKLSCTLENKAKLNYVWKKNGTEVTKIPELSGRLTEIAGNLTLKDRSSTADDAGNYTCQLNNTALIQGFQLRSRPLTKVGTPPVPEGNTNVVEKQKLKITCTVYGNPAPSVEWYYSNQSVAEAVESALNGNGTLAKDALGTVQTEEGVKERAIVNGTTLQINEASRTDAGVYTCVAKLTQEEKDALDQLNSAIKRVSHDFKPPEPGHTTLRVKDVYAALWPFLGICAEVLVLCAVILVYEKRRTKPELDDSDTDNHDQKKS